MKKVVSFRIDETYDSDIKDYPKFLAEAVDKIACPLCGKKWPAKEPVIRKNRSVRLDEKTAAKVNALSNSSGFIRIKVLEHLGRCILCEQKK